MPQFLIPSPSSACGADITITTTLTTPSFQVTPFPVRSLQKHCPLKGIFRFWPPSESSAMSIQYLRSQKCKKSPSNFFCNRIRLSHTMECLFSLLACPVAHVSVEIPAIFASKNGQPGRTSQPENHQDWNTPIFDRKK